MKTAFCWMTRRCSAAAAGCVLLAGLGFGSNNAAASTFAPTGVEQALSADASARLKPFSEQSVQTDSTGRTYYATDDDMRRSAETSSPDSGFIGNLWPGGIVYYQFDPAVSFSQRASWRDAAAAWSAVAAVTFQESTGNGNYIDVHTGNGNSSYVGMIGGAQEMNISEWGYKYVIAHEIAHALGAIHEHSRPDRDSYVRVLSANIRPEALVDFGIESSAVQIGSYDFDSVMHYARNAASRNGSNTLEPQPSYSQYLYSMGQYDHLSLSDTTGMAQRYRPPGPVVPNDFLRNAQIISGLEGTMMASNVGATAEPGEPLHAGQTGGKSVWFSWSAQRAGRVTFTTRGSTFNTLLAVYTGGNVGQLTPVAANDDISPGEVQSSVTFDVSYLSYFVIAVDGRDAAAGSISLSWSYASPLNDNFANASPLSGSNGFVQGHLLGATAEVGEPRHGRVAGHSAWYSWTAPSAGVLMLSVDGSFSPVLAVYTGTSLGGLTRVAQEESLGGDSRVETTFWVLAGMTYRIAVDGPASNSSPTYNLSWTLSGVAPPPNDAFQRRISLFGNSGSLVGTNVGATIEAGEPTHASSQGHSIWYALQAAPGDTMVTLDTFGSDFDAALTVFSGSFSLNVLSPITSATAGSPSGRARVSFFTQGSSFSAYSIAVDAATGSGGNLRLNWRLGGVKSDFNGDYSSDFIWQNTQTGERVVWFLRDGQYQSGSYLPTISKEWRIASAADFNSDGHSDLIWQNLNTGERVIWFLRNGQYQNSINLPTIARDWEIAGAADFNGDGYADLAWQNLNTGERVIWFLRSGQYISGVNLPTIATQWRITGAADFNKDGFADLIWQNDRTGERVIWFLRNGQYQSSISMDTILPEWRIAAAGDFNDDGYGDLAWQNINTGERVIWFLRNGTFQSGTYLAAIDPKWDIANH